MEATHNWLNFITYSHVWLNLGLVYMMLVNKELGETC